ncbi:MAG: hypothetical protein JRG74_12060 [Deltaproteobacteria bacterium]|nr:hypothetical protein [Deltaproteobacteria bacterium]
MKCYYIALNVIPGQGDTCAVTTPDLFKTAALLFDRVFVPIADSPGFEPPPTECYFADSTIRITNPLQAKEIRLDLTLEGIDDPLWLTHILVHYTEHLKIKNLDSGEIHPDSDKLLKKIAGAAMRGVSSAFLRKYGIRVTPLYSSMEMYDERTTKGDIVAYQGFLKHIPMVADREVSWEQILDFRSDGRAISHYRAIRSWVRDVISSKSSEEARDLVAAKIDKYEWAIRKHGLKTITGGLASVLDSKFLLALTGAGGIAGYLAGPLWAAAVAGSIAIAKSAVWFAETRINAEDVRRGEHSEVALIHEIREKFKTP